MAHKAGLSEVPRPAPSQSSTGSSGSSQRPDQAMMAMQTELLEVCDEIRAAWLSRVKSEVDFWTDTAAKMQDARSVSEAMSAYQSAVTQRMQIAADDGRRMISDGQKAFSAMSRAMSGGWPGIR